MSRKVWAAVVLGVALLSIVVAAVIGARNGAPGAYGAGGEAVGVVSIEGMIVGSAPSGPFASNASADDIVERLDMAREDDAIKAVVLRMNSPGGSAAASQEIADAVTRLRESGKVVVVSMSDVAASGAYWIACRADTIVANPATITGSIGVILETVQVQELYGKLGISNEVFKSGPHKDMGSPTRPVTEQERAIFQGMVDDIYHQFVDVVAQGRDLSRERVLQLADGRIYTGRQAEGLGLVDELGGLEDAIRIAADRAGIKGEPRVVEIGVPDFWSWLSSGFSSLGRMIDPGAWLLTDPVIRQR
ncbi:signal peptide peptidase SppA [Desulforudis sp. 1088]|uniref:signal peptide peptidase SppA n=1 Tax=unclassified Candidatus Desulforudis TaxID=2635950 RepID=UPI00348E684D